VRIWGYFATSKDIAIQDLFKYHFEVS